EREVQEAVEREERCQRSIRDVVFPRLAQQREVPAAGVYAVDLSEMRELHSGLLFPGGVECADGTCDLNDTLALTVYQIGVALVSYGGTHGTWSHRLFRRDLRRRHEDPVREALEILEQRKRRSALNRESNHDGLSRLARRAVMS